MRLNNFLKNELILRDKLAIDRTVLANERTLLAYLRTSLNFCLAGITIIKLFPSNLVFVVGGICIFLGVLSIYFGFFRYLKIKKI